MIDFIALLEAVFLGIVQGLTEFLPVSSSGHLNIFPWLFGWDTPGLVFDTSLHLGTALALLLFFYRDFLQMFHCICIPSKLKSKKEVHYHRKLTIFVLIGMIPAGVIGLLFDDVIETTFSGNNINHSIVIIGMMLVLFGVFLFLMDMFGKKQRNMEHLSLKDALLVGFLQIFALIPGASRSGVTITAGMLGGLTRETAARFSFLIGTPLTLAAGLYKLKDLADITMTLQVGLYFLVGFLASAITGYLCIKYFLKFLQSHSMNGFVIYRILIGTAVIAIALL